MRNASWRLTICLVLVGLLGCAAVSSWTPARDEVLARYRGYPVGTGYVLYAVHHRIGDRIQFGKWPATLCDGQPTNPTVAFQVCSYYGELPNYLTSNLWRYGDADVYQFQCADPPDRFVVCPRSEGG